MKTLSVSAIVCSVAVSAFAQAPASPPANPITASVGGQLAMVKGNIVTYLRLNKMVPPSSQGRGV